MLTFFARIVYDSSGDLGERKKTYEEWIHTAKVTAFIFSDMTITERGTRHAGTRITSHQPQRLSSLLPRRPSLG
jgi:hypothetical protein